MPDKPTHDRGNVEALEALHRSAGPPPPNRPAERPSAPRLRCLHCGYGLLEQSGFRCSECGTQYRIETLNRWFFRAGAKPFRARPMPGARRAAHRSGDPA